MLAKSNAGNEKKSSTFVQVPPSLIVNCEGTLKSNLLTITSRESYYTARETEWEISCMQGGAIRFETDIASRIHPVDQEREGKQKFRADTAQPSSPTSLLNYRNELHNKSDNDGE